MHWEARCLALRTRNGGLKNSFNPGEGINSSPIKKWTYHVSGKINNLDILY